MNTRRILLSFIILTLFTITFLGAAPYDKAKAKAVLVKTNNAIGMAHMTVKRTRKFSGKLGLSVKHERFAKKQYQAGNFDKAVLHSLAARKYATEVMAENGAKTNTLFILSAEEKSYVESKSAEELKKEVDEDSASELKDEELMNGNLNLEVI